MEGRLTAAAAAAAATGGSAWPVWPVSYPVELEADVPSVGGPAREEGDGVVLVVELAHQHLMQCDAHHREVVRGGGVILVCMYRPTLRCSRQRSFEKGSFEG